jgi:hypothetical protein
MTLPRIHQPASGDHCVQVSTPNKRPPAKPNACELPSGEQEAHVALAHVEHARSLGHIEERAAMVVTLGCIDPRK